MVTSTQLDYAFIADFAQVQDNKLTVVGASYTYLHTTSLPTQHLVSVAGRIRAAEGVQRVPVRIEIVPPAKSYSVSAELDIHGGPNIRPYNGKVGLLFAVSIQVPLIKEGLYEIFIDVEGRRQRRLAFEVQQQQRPTEQQM